MPRGFGRNYGKRSLLGYRFGGFYGLLDALLLIGMLYFLVKLLLVALPYALGLLVIFIIRGFLRPRIVF
ncbi:MULTISPECIES: hypothetical protein [Thermococcus]|uniref:Uncharacterized protein n=2 Tax=Thermococcus sibiricus TaxID=172049 RepID=C6A2B8_THESM|nr:MULTISPECIES: hypothetical protein [Thermococcus]ACS89763.1 hypothetical protein TSIB_0699 [Thermococcus sibiricus MM 739]KUK17136.1 MAG: Uncharacterized protein XD54_1557 [Thermococcus sibiricus]MBC7094319.1 hypothetical protein [Thermococcus sp.]HII67114.1 hypothetical protein [Thermococcaceae archaeon]